MEEIGPRWLLGQGVSLVALALCLVAFASNVLAGSIGGTIAESLIFVTNVITMLRLRRDARLRYIHG